MKQLFLCHLHSCVISLFSDSAASLYLFHLFWREQLNSKNRGRDDSWSFLVFYEYFPMVWISLFARSAQKTVRPAEGEGR